ncbi:MAG: ABC transporter ATP-binding protein [Candidatus Thorarchaeota archaeon]|nr:MAG: ABC transporter ATP-binding protein [Candidatus Thorarchaeota archaeon]RLI57079.1 MAG: ABC transporter ATP-binding protein [Candidatus Thorarchaeota archaeon]
MTSEPVLQVKDLATYYYLGDKELKAVDGVSFDIQSGRTLGLAGESGCGKTTTAYSIMRILAENGQIVRGSVKLGGLELTSLSDEEIRKVRWKKASIVFQYAMNAFNPVLRIGRQIVEVIREKDDVSEEEAVMTVSSLFDEVGLKPERQNEYPHEFSGGMLQRAIIAQALACDPQLIIADEPVTALDVIVQNKILDLLRNLQKKYNLAVLFITHDLSVVAENCHDVGIMYAGNLVEVGDATAVFKRSLHPYSYKLIGAFPSVIGPKKRLHFIPGTPPNLLDLPKGCKFHPRCPFAKDICKTEEPEFREIEKGHYAKCHFAGELDLGGA